MKDPAVLFYTKDFLTGTSFFSDAERGQYIRLLCEQHQNGHIPENHMVSVCLSLGSPVVKKFVQDKDGMYYNERMDIEIEKRRQFTESRRINGEKGGRPKDSKKPLAKPLGLPTENLVADANGIVINNNNGIDYDFIISNYHTLCQNMAKVEKLTQKRKGFVNARFGEFGMEKITEVLRKAGESKFLNGSNDRAWKADFEWIMRPENFVKIMEGKYMNKDEYVKLSA